MVISKLLVCALMGILSAGSLWALAPPSEAGNLVYYRKGLGDDYALQYVNNNYIKDAEICVKGFVSLENLEYEGELPYCVVVPSGAKGVEVLRLKVLRPRKGWSWHSDTDVRWLE